MTGRLQSFVCLKNLHEKYNRLKNIKPIPGTPYI
jgi:hypothetical protein